MFDLQIKELYKYLTKNILDNNFSIIKTERKSIIQYTTDEYKWILAPNTSFITKENYSTKYRVKDSTHLFFIDALNFGDIRNSSMCRKVTKEDKDLFNEFKDSCSEEDKEEGMVSLDDDCVYALFHQGKIVAVASLWNWGNVISDIGILVDPSYRKMGYAKSVCQYLMANVDRKFVWRCNSLNKASYNLAISIGFIKSGLIQELIINE